MTPENEAKTNYLKRYKWDLKALEEIEGEITACRLGALPGQQCRSLKLRGTNR